MVTVTIQLIGAEAEALRRPIHGQGGFQGLLRSLQDKLDGTKLSLRLTDIRQINRYVGSYGPGGFQERLTGVLQGLRRLNKALGENL
jgi:hypothetical protein